jgi:hypothetical protein
MSSTRITRSSAPHRSPSASPTATKKKPTTTVEKQSTKKNKTVFKEVIMRDEGEEDNAEAEESQSEDQMEVDLPTPIRASSDRGGINQLLAQQQKQIELLTQLAVLNSNRNDSSSSAGAARGADSPTPKGSFDRRYKGDGGAVLDEWISYGTQMLAFYSGLNGTQSAVWLATGLEGAALAWYQNQFKLQPPASGSALFDALRKRFQPINSEETTRYELAALKQGPKQSVDEYATRFLHLTSLLPDESVASRVFQFRLGLHRSIDEKLRQAASLPATLEDTIALAARIEGRGVPSVHGEQLANMEMDSVSSAILSRLAAMEQKFDSSSNSSAGNRQPYDSRRDRGANKQFTPVWKQIPGMTGELAEKRRAAHQCYWCASGAHTLRDCADRVNKKPANLKELALRK